MMGRTKKLPFTLGLIVTLIAYTAAQVEDAIVEPYWERRTLNEFEEFPVKFPSSDADDGKLIFMVFVS